MSRHHFTAEAEREQADAVALHEDYVKRIRRDVHKLDAALNDLLADKAARLELARIAQLSESDAAEAGRLLKNFADQAAHECARFWMGDDGELVAPHGIDNLPDAMAALVNAARGVPKP